MAIEKKAWPHGILARFKEDGTLSGVAFYKAEEIWEDGLKTHSKEGAAIAFESLTGDDRDFVEAFLGKASVDALAQLSLEVAAHKVTKTELAEKKTLLDEANRRLSELPNLNSAPTQPLGRLGSSTANQGAVFTNPE